MKPTVLCPALVAALLCFSPACDLDAAGPQSAERPAAEEEGLGRAECLDWVDRTYRVEALSKELGVELETDYSELRSCVARDVRHMAVPIPVPWCDNIFKIHCSGVDLLTEIGEALILRCEDHLTESLGGESIEEAAWKRCGRDRVFDDYSLRGRASDEEACETAFRNGCESGASG